MRTCRVFSARNLRIAVLCVLLVFPLVGCDDSTTSPCIECPSANDDGRFTTVVEKRFTLPGGAIVRVDDFAGRVTYRPGGAGTILIVATKRAATPAALDRLDVEMIAGDGVLDIKVDNPMNLKYVSVDLEITAPADAIPRINTGVGEIDYEGRPTGDLYFGTGVGSIKLRLPADINITVDLSASVGSVHLDFPVDGSVSTHPGVVQGKIGRGDEGHLQARTAVGSIYLTRL